MIARTPLNMQNEEIKNDSNTAPSFETLLLAYERPIFGYAYRMLGGREDAEDITQETFLKLYRHRRRLDPQKNIKAFIYAIATNLIYDLFRRRRLRPELFILDHPETPFETIDPQTPYSSIEAAVDIAPALAKIPLMYRSILLLFYKEDFSYEQIAMLLSLPLNTVKTRIRRAKSALRKHLTSYGSG